MKKLLFIITPLIIICALAISSLLSQNNSLKSGDNQETSQIKSRTGKTSGKNEEHNSQKLTCKTCHISEYPIQNDPGLRNCPRDKMLSDFPSFKSGPDVVVIDAMSENYSGVTFSHGVHSQMSEMSLGCADCHHYNTSTEKILSCSDCHSNSRYREDISVPDLKSAYHRQCLMCHKEWSHENSCNSVCHVRKGQENNIPKKDYKGKNHPKRTEPAKMTWETNYEKGKIVTFYHNEHNQLFKVNCKSCHSTDRCIKCHDKPKQQTDYSKPILTTKSFDEHHMPCLNCHKKDNCSKCHSDIEMAPFNHGKSTGWVLKSYHGQLACSKCHGNQMPLKKLDRNCGNCHKNFLTGKFDHNKTGLALDEIHREIECFSCHANNDFTKNPVCKSCHDDKSFPAQSPGKRR